MSLRKFLKFVLLIIFCAQGVMSSRQLVEQGAVSITVGLIGPIVVGFLLLLLLVLKATGILRSSEERCREVPKRPLGLDS
jgi:hypothetical protein